MLVAGFIGRGFLELRVEWISGSGADFTRSLQKSRSTQAMNPNIGVIGGEGEGRRTISHSAESKGAAVLAPLAAQPHPHRTFSLAWSFSPCEIHS